MAWLALLVACAPSLDTDPDAAADTDVSDTDVPDPDTDPDTDPADTDDTDPADSDDTDPADTDVDVPCDCGRTPVTVAYDYASRYVGPIEVYPTCACGVDDDPSWSLSGAGTGDMVYVDLRDTRAAGDVDGDGFGDLLVGAFNGVSSGHDTGIGDGRVGLFRGSAAGLETSPDWIAIGPYRAYFGSVVASAGDTNADGFGDVVITASYGDDLAAGLWVYAGSADGLPADASWTSPRAAGFGSVAALDVDGDGFGDLAAATSYYASVVDVYFGASDGIDPERTASYGLDGDASPIVAPAGDVDGDGFDDLLVGTGIEGRSRVDLYFGSPAGLDAPAHLGPGAWTASSWTTGEFTTAGDVDGDGFDDVVALTSDDTVAHSASLYLGGPDGLAETPAWTDAYDGSSGFGRTIAVASLGDLDGDALGDFAVRGGKDGAEKSYLYRGSPEGPVSSGFLPAGRYPPATAGDVDGDGYGEILAFR